MRESQMKKIIAAAVATAFVAPVFAADVTLTGATDWYYKDVDGVTSTGFDSDVFTIKATTETAAGIAVSVDFNLTSEGEDDGGASVDLSGDFGKIELGDTSNAADKFDDMTDVDVVVGPSLAGSDAAIGWTLPIMVEGLTVYLSHSADASDDESGQTAAHTGYAAKYAMGPVSVAYGKADADVNSADQAYVGASATFQGVTVMYEEMTNGDSSAETVEEAFGLSYSMGDMTINFVQEETTAGGAVTSDITFVGVKYSLGGGVTAFAEQASNDTNDSDATAVGVSVSF
jgi:outer membrane protein OmpU